jgi:hypothetical protein
MTNLLLTLVRREYKHNKETSFENVDWIRLPQDKAQLRIFTNPIALFSIIVGNFKLMNN